MQKFPPRNRKRTNLIGNSLVGNNRPRPTTGLKGTPNGSRGVSAVTTRLTSATKPPVVRICNRVLAHEDTVTWDEVLSVGGGKSKSCLSPASSSQGDSGTATAVTTQGPEQQTSATILEMPSTASAATNNNRNKDDDDNNRRNYRIIATPRRAPETGAATTAATVAAAAAASASGATPAGASTAREFMTFEQLRLGDQINFLLFDPYRTLKFLITELKSRLRVVAPDDINAHKILVEIQQAVKRVRASSAAKPTTPVLVSAKQPRASQPSAADGWCIQPCERCHVIKEDPLINHARKVNSSCQTMESQLENVNACQMCEHQVRQDAAGCNQKRMNGNSNAEDGRRMMEVDDAAKAHQRSKDHKEGAEVEKRFNYKSLQDAIDILKSRTNPSLEDTQRIITQLETELLGIQTGRGDGGGTLHLHPMPQLKTPGIRSTAENSKVQCKRRPNEDTERTESEDERPQHDIEDEQKETFPNFNAKVSPTPSKFNSSIQAAADTTSKEAQTNLKNPSQLLCHLEKEKFMLLQRFRIAEMQNIQVDLNELHVFIRDQLDGIYHSITEVNLKTKYHLSGRRSFKNKKTRQKTASAAPKPPITAQPSSSTPSLTAPTSSALSSNELVVDPPVTTPESSTSPGGQFDNLAPHPISGSANITKSMMKQKYKQRQKAEGEQKLSPSSLSALDAKDSDDISDVDKANKTMGEKKSKGHHSRQHQLCGQHHHFSNDKCCCAAAAAAAAAPVDTPCWNEKRIHYSAVECVGCRRCRHSDALTAELARTSIHCDAKSTTKTSLAAMTHHQHRQQCQHQPMTMATATTISAAQEQTQLMPAQPTVVPPPRPQPYTFMKTVPEVRARLSLDSMTNATVRTVIPKPDHSDGIRGHQSLLNCQSKNSWQCVNPKNPACCQLKKQICGNVYEPKINKNNNINGSTNDNDNHSNCPEIHDCQKCWPNTVHWFGGLGSAQMHGVGVDNSAPCSVPQRPVTAPMQTPADRGAKGGGVDAADVGGDGPIYRSEGDFIFHIGQQKLKNLNSKPPTEVFQTDFEEFKEFLDEIVFSTPRLK